jgi:S-adenosylmethionine hydrolase
MDPYVAEIKAVMLSICPHARIVDISHLVEKFNIRIGAFLLASACPAFPAGTVHVAVVDPGVGGERRPIVIETSRSVFVGPDNGLLIPAALSESILGVYKVTNRSLMRVDVSSTFHGRDIFAPVAGHIASGLKPEECGVPISNYVTPSYSIPRVSHGKAICEVFHVDGFGNVITNLRSNHVSTLSWATGKNLRIELGKKRTVARYVGTYSELERNETGVLVGSHDFVEIASREGSAAKRLGAKTGMAVQISSA